MVKKPPFRKLRGYAFDPSLSLKIDTALINDITYKIPWEDGEDLKPGPIGQYIQVIDYDPTVNKFYSPVDLNHPYILAQDGLNPSGSNPQFHQQMVYAVAMTTIKNFESGLGRPVLWSPHRVKEAVSTNPGDNNDNLGNPEEIIKVRDEYVPALRIYPHALRDANAFYSPQKKALLFGYFAARPADVTLLMPDNLTFTCLSHDIIAHETTHAIMDGLHRKYTEDTNPDVLAFHEAFADIVALFQHFTFPDVLKNQIAATRGDLASQNLLGKLAQEFGIAIGNYGALRDAIGTFDKKKKTWTPKEPTGDEYRTIMEPHERGAILVSAVFEAFLTIYKNRVADLLRIATGGTGILQQGELQPDLVNRMAAEASKASSHVLNMCIRALDFCPPVDITFGDFLRAVITADTDLVADDSRDYRLAFIDAFRKRGIYPNGIKHLSAESLNYQEPETRDLQELFDILVGFLRDYRNEIIYTNKRKKIFEINRKYIAGSYDTDQKIFGLHRRLNVKFDNSIGFEKLTGLMFSNNWQSLGIPTSTAYGGRRASFSVHSLHLASRVGPNGNQRNQIIVALVQRANIKIQKDNNNFLQISPGDTDKSFVVNGGCTLIFDVDTLRLKYAISKPLLDTDVLNNNIHQLNRSRCMALHQHQYSSIADQSQFQAYFGMGKQNAFNEPFNFLHNHKSYDMSKAINTTGKISKINVRMYRAGTGDFFILQFKKENIKSFNMMIDCGCINGGKAQFKPMVEDLIAHTGGVIDLLVVTHQHADHINGFEKSADLFNQLTFKKVWFAWTEDEDDPIANDYRANHSELGMALSIAVNKLNSLVKDKYYESLFANELAGDLMLEGKKHFIHSLSGLNALNPINNLGVGVPLPTMVELFKNYKVIKPGTEVEFLEPGDVRTDLSGATGIRFYVLGPPREKAFLNRTEKDGENFEQREEKSKIDFAFLSAIGATVLNDGVNNLPFDTEYEIPGEKNASQKEYYEGGDWRKIDYDWLYSAGNLAMRYERSINNTSLALAIQFEDSERVLLFPGDAEFGNWESWHIGLEWPVKISGQVIKKKAEYFLNKTVFYKVGHHLSQNGTAKGKGIDLMSSPDLAAMATLDFKKINDGWLNTMPNDLLGAELIRKTKGKLFFVGDRKKILANINTARVSIKKTNETALNNANKPFDGKNFIEYEVHG